MLSMMAYKSRAETVLAHRNGSNRIEPIQEGRMASHSICKIDGCNKRQIARGWCEAHYRRWQRHGDPEAGRVPHGEPMAWMRDHVGFSEDRCLRWPYGRGDDGYGRVARDGSWPRASRVMCELVNGKPPSSIHQACHSCGKGHEACVNPRHLYWGTPLENQADRIGHGTHHKGEQVPNAKLTEAQVREVRRLSQIMPQKDVAARLGISKQRVSKIVRREQWAWLE